LPSELSSGRLPFNIQWNAIGERQQARSAHPHWSHAVFSNVVNRWRPQARANLNALLSASCYLEETVAGAHLDCPETILKHAADKTAGKSLRRQISRDRVPLPMKKTSALRANP